MCRGGDFSLRDSQGSHFRNIVSLAYCQLKLKCDVSMLFSMKSMGIVGSNASTDFINVADDVDSILNVKYVGIWEAGSDGGWLVVQE